MANMTVAQRAELWAEFMRELSDAREPISITKVDLRAAVDAADAWASTNAAAYNTALPQPARNSLTAAQKSRLLMFVIQMRYGVGA